MSQDLVPLLSKGIDNQYAMEYNELPSIYPQIFHTDTMDGRYTDDQMWEMYKQPGRRSPLEPVLLDTIKPSFSKRYVPVNYGLADYIAQEDWDDDQYGVLSRLLPAKGGALARSHKILKERVAAGFMTSIGFATDAANTPTTSDGRPLFSSAHPVSRANSGVTYANTPLVQADLSISSYQAGATNIMQQFATNNYEIINNKPRCLVVNTDLRYVGKQIVNAEWERGTADRNTNYIKDDNVKLVEWAYFRASGASGTRNSWFMAGDTHYLRFIERQDTKIKTDYALAVLAFLFVSYCRFVVGATDWRGTYGSRGI